MITSTYDVNRLDENETADLIRIFNEYGCYITENKGNEDYIKNNLKMQSIMLEFFKHQGITSELKRTIDKIKSCEVNKQYVDFIIYLLIIKILSLDLDFHGIIQCTNYSINMNFAKDIYINEFVDFRGGKIKIKSSAHAVWLINQIFIKNKIIPFLVKIVKQANENYKINKKYENLLRNIISFKHLKFLFDVLDISSADKKIWLMNSMRA